MLGKLGFNKTNTEISAPIFLGTHFPTQSKNRYQFMIKNEINNQRKATGIMRETHMDKHLNQKQIFTKIKISFPNRSLITIAPM